MGVFFDDGEHLAVEGSVCTSAARFLREAQSAVSQPRSSFQIGQQDLSRRSTWNQPISLTPRRIALTSSLCLFHIPTLPGTQRRLCPSPLRYPGREIERIQFPLPATSRVLGFMLKGLANNYVSHRQPSIFFSALFRNTLDCLFQFLLEAIVHYPLHKEVVCIACAIAIFIFAL